MFVYNLQQLLKIISPSQVFKGRDDLKSHLTTVIPKLPLGFAFIVDAVSADPITRNVAVQWHLESSSSGSSSGSSSNLGSGARCVPLISYHHCYCIFGVFTFLSLFACNACICFSSFH